MRIRVAAALAVISGPAAVPVLSAAAVFAMFGGTALAQAQTTIAVPPAPVLVPQQAPAAPAAPAPAPVTPPPGLTQTLLPPPPDDNSASSPSDATTNAPSDATTPASNGSSTAPAAGAQPAAPNSPPVIPNTWTPGTTAVLGVLNKVDGSASDLSIPVGGQATAGDLQINLQSCVSRPAGQVPDAAVFLTVQTTGTGSSAPLYRGWMVRSAPGATVVGDAGETFRVISCS